MVQLEWIFKVQTLVRGIRRPHEVHTLHRVIGMMKLRLLSWITLRNAVQESSCSGYIRTVRLPKLHVRFLSTGKLSTIVQRHYQIETMSRIASVSGFGRARLHEAVKAKDECATYGLDLKS